MINWCTLERGRQALLADHLGLRAPQIADWLNGKKRVPLDHCPYIEKFTGGAVTCEELRPDKADYFSLLRDTSSPNSKQKPPGVPAVRTSAAINSVAAQGV